MSIDEFLRDYSGAPFDLDDLAAMISTQVSDDRLRLTAKNYLDAKRLFEFTLKKSGFQVG